jgi:very-short-patch-repair endonuclease
VSKNEKSEAEKAFLEAWRQLPFSSRLPEPVGELVFHPVRKWRFDFAWPAEKLAVEIDGRGRHMTVEGFREGCLKRNEALLLGWRVLHFPATDKKDAYEWVHMCCRALTHGITFEGLEDGRKDTIPVNAQLRRRKGKRAPAHSRQLPGKASSQAARNVVDAGWSGALVAGEAGQPGTSLVGAEAAYCGRSGPCFSVDCIMSGIARAAEPGRELRHEAAASGAKGK